MGKDERLAYMHIHFSKILTHFSGESNLNDWSDFLEFVTVTEKFPSVSFKYVIKTEKIQNIREKKNDFNTRAEHTLGCIQYRTVALSINC